MIKLLIGGSPCTYWSIARFENRETEPGGLGWELFENYLFAKERFNPDFFLYENNMSAAQPIKDEIKKRLSAENEAALAQYIEINSSLLSAQNRKRFYVHNCGMVDLPNDKKITLPDILEASANTIIYAEKISTILKALPKLERKYGYIPEMFNAYNIAEIKEKSPTLSTGSMSTSSCATILFQKSKNTGYKVNDFQITINGVQYKTKLSDGFYDLRILTVEECCRLQTLPDNYCNAVSSRQAYKALGNGWTAEVIMHILQGALCNIPKDEEIVVLSMYDGIGTGRYCLDKMGFTNVRYYAYEIDKYAMKIANSNYPDIIQCGNAFQLKNKDWRLPF